MAGLPGRRQSGFIIFLGSPTIVGPSDSFPPASNFGLGPVDPNRDFFFSVESNAVPLPPPPCSWAPVSWAWRAAEAERILMSWGKCSTRRKAETESHESFKEEQIAGLPGKGQSGFF